MPLQPLKLDYFYGGEADQYSFYRIPKVLFTDPCYLTLSMEARVLYGLMLDRMSLSARNGWLDAGGRVYIFFTMEDAMAQMGFGHNKAVHHFKELEGIGLIERKKQGQGKPTRIYVKNFVLPSEPEQGKSAVPEPPSETSQKRKSAPPCMEDDTTETSSNGKSALPRGGSQDFPKTNANNTERNKTEKSDTELSIPPSPPAPPQCPFERRTPQDEIDQMEKCRAQIKENIDYDALVEQRPYDVDLIDGYIELMLEVFCSTRSTVRISGNDLPVSVVQARFLRLTQEHIGIITQEENIRLAYRNLKKNAGSKTPGTDGKTIRDLAKLSEVELIDTVQQKFRWYQPQSVRRKEIPKGNGKMRPLGIPTILDRLIQQCILQVMEPICEAKFCDTSNGFRPNRGVENALAQAEKHMQKSNLHIVIDIDIKAFFDNVSHGKLLRQIWAMGIHDKKLLCIISAMLKAEVAGIGFPEKGTPQGGVISPLLSNIVLNELDWWITSQWVGIPTRHEYSGRIHKTGVKDQSKKYRELRKTKLKECYIVRYADDFKIFCRKHKDAVKLFAATKAWLKERLGLDISPEKSKIVNLKHEYYK